MRRFPDFIVKFLSKCEHQGVKNAVIQQAFTGIYFAQ